MKIQVSSKYWLRKGMMPPIKQSVSVLSGMIVRENKRKCLECKGLYKIAIGGKAFDGWQDRNMPYRHAPNCSRS